MDDKISLFSITDIIPVLYSGDAGSIPAGGSCENCREPTDNNRFCSLTCSVSWQQKARPWPIGYCIACSKVFNKRGQPAKKYCSRSCAASVNNKSFPKRKPAPRKQCFSCSSYLTSSSQKYCNLQCQHRFLYHQKVTNWLAGKDHGCTSIGTVKPFIKKWLREKYNNRCSRCGWNEINPHTGKVPLEAEHIDGNWKNNTPENLDLLCPNCHSLTSTYRSLNTGKGRSWRRQPQ